MLERVRVGFVGAGNMATRVHYPSLAEMDDVDLVAIAELNPERLQAAADRYAVPGRYGDFRAMLDREKPDAVYVIMPPHHLHDIVVECLQRGKHVMVEKPPGITTYQTQALAWYAAKHACLTMVAFNRRFVPMLRRCKALAEERGPINQCLVGFHKYEPGPDNFGFYRGAASHLASDIIHAVDALRWIAGGTVVAVAADHRALGAPYANCHNALMTFDSGCTAILTANRHAGKRSHYFEMHGDGVSAYADDQSSATVYRDGDEEGLQISAAAEAGSDEFHRRFGFFAENRHFIDCVKSGAQPLTNFADAAETMALLDRILASQI